MNRIYFREYEQNREMLLTENKRNLKRLSRKDRDHLIVSNHISNPVKLLAI